jgi:hypothetical protein
MLAVLDQNPEARWQDLLGAVQISADTPAAEDSVRDVGPRTGDGDDLTSLRIGT